MIRCGHRQLGVLAAPELQQGSVRIHAREELAEIDRTYGCSALIVADLTYDPTDAEILLQTFPGG